MQCDVVGSQRQTEKLISIRVQLLFERSGTTNSQLFPKLRIPLVTPKKIVKAFKHSNNSFTGYDNSPLATFLPNNTNTVVEDGISLTNSFIDKRLLTFPLGFWFHLLAR
jgi:hypothetical protein